VNGPEHYRAAEQLLERAATGSDGGELVNGGWFSSDADTIAAAAVHATLALAAATAGRRVEAESKPGIVWVNPPTGWDDIVRAADGPVIVPTVKES